MAVTHEPTLAEECPILPRSIVSTVQFRLTIMTAVRDIEINKASPSSMSVLSVYVEIAPSALRVKNDLLSNSKDDMDSMSPTHS